MSKADKTYFKEQYPKMFGRALLNESSLRPDTRMVNIFQIIDAFDNSPEMESLRWLAYILGTSMHESNDTFAPVVEGYWIKPESKRVAALYNYYSKNNPKALRTIFPNGKYGTAFYGRGRVVQLTHDFNYKSASFKIYNDNRLYKNPELIITDVNCDMAVTFRGMLEGWFTGYKLAQFFPLGSNKANWAGARKIINGLDKANLIAGYAMKFYDCLRFEPD